MRRRGVFLLLLVLFSCIFAVPTHAAEDAQTPEELLEEIRDNLPDIAGAALPDDLQDTAALKEKVGFTALFSRLFACVTQGAKSLSPVFLKMLGITLLFACASLFAPGDGSMIPKCMSAAAALSLFSLLSGSLESVFSYFHDLGLISSVFSPVYATLFAAGGGAGTAAAAGVGFASFLSVLETLCVGLLGPLLRVLFSLALVSSFGSVPAVSELSGALKGFYLFVLSLICMLLTASLAFETGLSGAADSVAVRTVKFAVGNAIPVVGGTVSATLGTLSASLSYVKGALGASAVVVLCATVFPVLSELLLLRLMLSLCRALAAMLGAGAMEGMLSKFRSLYDLMLGTVAIVSVLFLIMTGILSRCALPLVAL